MGKQESAKLSKQNSAADLDTVNNGFLCTIARSLHTDTPILCCAFEHCLEYFPTIYDQIMLVIIQVLAKLGMKLFARVGSGQE